MGHLHRAGLGYREPIAGQSSPSMQQRIQFRGKSPAPCWEKGGVLGALQTYPQKPLQELPGAVDVDAGDVAIAPQHAIHCGGHILPVLLCLGVKLKLVLHHLAGHAGQGHTPARDSLLPWHGRTPNQQGMSQLCQYPTSVYHPFSLPRDTANSKNLQLRARSKSWYFLDINKAKTPPWADASARTGMAEPSSAIHPII